MVLLLFFCFYYCFPYLINCYISIYYIYILYIYHLSCSCSACSVILLILNHRPNSSIGEALVFKLQHTFLPPTALLCPRRSSTEGWRVFLVVMETIVGSLLWCGYLSSVFSIFCITSCGDLCIMPFGDCTLLQTTHLPLPQAKILPQVRSKC